MGIDPNWADVVFLLDTEGASPTDVSTLAQTVTVNGTAAVSTGQVKYGTQSLHIAAADDSVQVPDHASFSLNGLTPFTIDLWVYPTTLGSESFLISQYDETNELGWIVRHYAGFGIWFEFYEPGFYTGISSDYQLTLNAWNFVSVDFDGTNFRIYGDGVMHGKETHASVSSPGDIEAATGVQLMVGSAKDGGSDLVGYVYDPRLTVGTARYASDSGFLPPTDTFDRGVDDGEREIIEGLGLFAGAGLGDVINDTLTDGVGTTSLLTVLRVFPRTISDNISLIYGLGAIKRLPALAEAAVGVSTDVIASYGVVIRERLRVQLAQLANHKFQLGLIDDVGLDSLVRVGVPVTIAEEIETDVTLQASYVLRIIEALRLTPVIAPMFKYGKSISDTLRLSEQLLQAFGGELADGLGLADTHVATAARLASISEGLGIDETPSPQMLLRVTASDTLELSAEDALNMLFSGVVADGIEFAAAYLSPSDTITTWAMNTRSGAVSEYTNFAFNSFAEFGHKYIAASETGLYELLGDDDDGTDIVSRIKSGYAQWGGGKFTMFKAAYMAVRGGGDYVLKITTGDNKTYSYAVSARDMRTTKVNIGKGIRTRYFAFELISDGDDYDLESLEFVPIVTDRRI